MNRLACCKKSSWVSELDLGYVRGFEFILGKCDRCGTYWMNVFCVATGITGFERVSSTDVERMKSISTGPELKVFMRSWGEENIGF
jgi:hypothetical protein